MELNWTLIAVAAILIIGAIIGCVKGFVKMMVSFVSVALTIVLVWFAQPYINDFIVNNTKIYENIKDKCVNYVEDEMNKKIEDKHISKDSPQVVATEGDDMLKNSWLSIVQKYTELAKEKAGETLEHTIAGFSDGIGATLATIILKVIIFAVSFLVITVLLKVLFVALDLLTKLPVVHTLNKTAGLLLGLIISILVVWLLMMVIVVFFNTSLGSYVLKDVQSNEFLRFVYTNNPLIRLFAA